MSGADALDLVRGEVARAMLPGVAPADPIDLQTELLLVNLVASLQRVVTGAGSGDRHFLRSVRGVKPTVLSANQREHVMRLAWRYRLQLPVGLRPACNPDQRSAGA